MVGDVGDVRDVRDVRDVGNAGDVGDVEDVVTLLHRPNDTKKIKLVHTKLKRFVHKRKKI